MSKSKRSELEIPAPAPRRKGRVFSRDGGALRTGWLLAISVISYALVALAARYGLVRAFGALFTAWGIDAVSAPRAPAWAKWLYTWHGSLATLAFAALCLGLCRFLRGLWLRENRPSGLDWRTGLRACACGMLGALLVAALCLLPDSVRPDWPLTAPRFTSALPALCLVSLASAVAEEAFTKRVLFDGVRSRWGFGWATAIACAAFLLSNGGAFADPVGALNVALLGLVGCLVHARWGWGAAIGLRWGWSAVNMFLLGFGSGGASLYRLYGVSEVLLTGGDAGPVYGLWTTLLLGGTAAGLLLRLRRDGAPIPGPKRDAAAR